MIFCTKNLNHHSSKVMKLCFFLIYFAITQFRLIKSFSSFYKKKTSCLHDCTFIKNNELQQLICKTSNTRLSKTLSSTSQLVCGRIAFTQPQDNCRYNFKAFSSSFNHITKYIIWSREQEKWGALSLNSSFTEESKAHRASSRLALTVR